MALPTRCFPMIFCDGNCRLGKQKNALNEWVAGESKAVGEYHAENENVQGRMLRELYRKLVCHR